jgi:ABC-type Zn uptake system ZnuABC Zn-binding protein ZnuA
MMRKALITLLFLALPVSGSAAADTPVVVATTTMIKSMLELLAGGELDIRLLIPPGACPGHFDLKPKDAAGLAEAELIIRHDFQNFLDRKLSAQNSGLEIAIIETPGHLVVPANYLGALLQMRRILEARFPGLKSSLEQNLALASRRVEQAELKAGELIAGAGYDGARVLASVRQRGFLLWAGVHVVATFPNAPEDVSVLQMKKILDSARIGRAALVVGNLQGGGPVLARTLSGELGIPRCLLSSFPGTGARNKNYFDLLQDNLNQLLQTFPYQEHP